ncbi:MAG: glycoside hydrolase family 15 protein [Candidatus Jordarchaeales archaeon]
MIEANGIFGNGRMLGVLSWEGDVRWLSWPMIDFPNHVERISFGFSWKGRGEWLGDGWKHQANYINGANVIFLNSWKGGWHVARYVFALPNENVAVFSFKVSGVHNREGNIAIEFFGHFKISESEIGNAVFYDVEREAMVFYKRGYYFAVGGDRPVNEYSCFRMDRWNSFGLRWKIRGGRGNRYAIGDVGGYLKWDLGKLSGREGEVTVYVCCGETDDDAIFLLNEKAKEPVKKHLEEAINEGNNFTSRSRIDGIGVARSLLAMRLLCDGGGGIIAAPEFDPKLQHSGGYRYVWGRDATFIAYAFDIAGYHELSRKFYIWCSGLKKKGGLLLQRYCCDGRLASQWGDVQLDETGTVLWGLRKHIEMTEDYDLLSALSPMVEEMAEGLARAVDDRGLLAPCFDLWEERRGVHAYSTAAVYAGLESAAKMMEELGSGERGEAWREAARKLKESFDQFFWNGEHYVRALSANGLKPDPTPDSSLLGLAVPYMFVEPASTKMRATAEWLERELKRREGVFRYKKDKYFGGNFWTVATLWLALYKAELGRREEAEELAEWCLAHSKLGLIPEQVHRKKGKPLSATPLGWSHAFYVMLMKRLEGGSLWMRS